MRTEEEIKAEIAEAVSTIAEAKREIIHAQDVIEATNIKINALEWCLRTTPCDAPKISVEEIIGETLTLKEPPAPIPNTPDPEEEEEKGFPTPKKKTPWIGKPQPKEMRFPEDRDTY